MEQENIRICKECKKEKSSLYESFDGFWRCEECNGMKELREGLERYAKKWQEKINQRKFWNKMNPEKEKIKEEIREKITWIIKENKEFPILKKAEEIQELLEIEVCENCELRITFYEYNKNKGLCNECVKCGISTIKNYVWDNSNPQKLVFER